MKTNYGYCIITKPRKRIKTSECRKLGEAKCRISQTNM